MPDRLDAHIHLFEHGYGGKNPRIAEVDQYAELAKAHDIKAALTVGYEGQPWAAGNNAYLAQLMQVHPWIRATAYAAANRWSVSQLEKWAEQSFVGISLYSQNLPSIAGLLIKSSEAIWAWLAERRWIISLNASQLTWRTWRTVLEQHPTLRVCISHLGLPAAQSASPPRQTAEKLLAPVTALAPFEGVHVKLSGFYALTQPAHDYPHRAAWPYAQTLLKHFGPGRLLWGSDFTPALAAVSFPQTLDVLRHVPRLSQAARRCIEGENLRRLLGEIH